MVTALRISVELQKTTTSRGSCRTNMARYARVLLLAQHVSLMSVLATSSDNTVASTAQPDLLQNFTEKSNEEFPRARPPRPSSSGNNQKPASEAKVATELEAFVEKKLIQNKLNRDVNNVDEFWKKRNALAELEVKKLLGNHMPLDETEVEANKIILSKKFMEYNKVFSPTKIFPPSVSFFQAKSLIERSSIFKIIRKMPKGACLYNLLITSVPLPFMYQLTFEDNLYFRFENKLQFKFSKTRPAPGWRLLYEFRKIDDAQLVEDLNMEIKERLSLVVSNQEETGELNQTFSDVLEVYTSLTTYKPNFEKTFKTVLETLYEDNVMYAELGYDFPEIFDLDGKVYCPVEILGLCKAILNDFIKTHEDFVGIRFMYIPLTSLTSENLRRFRKIVIGLWRSNKELIAGFGLLRMSEAEKPWSYWAEELLKFPKEMKLFLDAGVTKNWGTDADYDLLDALTLNVGAIGEGLAVSKHPVVLEQLRNKDVPVITFPIFCQATNYVPDLRNHPLTLLVALNAPVVIGNGAGTIWNDTGLSYNWYEAYMAMTPRFCDLRCLKQFALNSWLYCSLSDEEKKKSIKAWQVMWDHFIHNVVREYGLDPRSQNHTEIIEDNANADESL